MGRWTSLAGSASLGMAFCMIGGTLAAAQEVARSGPSIATTSRDEAFSLNELVDLVSTRYPADYAGARMTSESRLTIGFRSTVPRGVEILVAQAKGRVDLRENLGFSQAEQLEAVDQVFESIADVAKKATFLVVPEVLSRRIIVEVNPKSVSVREASVLAESEDGGAPAGKSHLLEGSPKVEVTIDETIGGDPHARDVAEGVKTAIKGTEAAAEFDLNLNVRSDQDGVEATASLLGGNSLGACTSGFPATYAGYKGLITAGHCFTASAKYKGSVTMTVRKREFGSGAYGDIAFLSMPSGNTLTTKFQYDKGKNADVKSNNSVVPGQGICAFGEATKKKRCAKVFQINAKGSTKGVAVKNMVLAEGHLSQGGDSGGPVFGYSDKTMAVGIMSGVGSVNSPQRRQTVFVTVIQPTAYLGKYGISLYMKK